MFKMKRGLCLKPGNRIALIAPSSPVSAEKLALSIRSVEFLNMIPIVYPSCTEKHGYLAGTDDLRLKDIHDAFSDPEIDGIFCIRGGYGTTRLLPHLDYEMIAAHPKLFLGYSDITALHTAFQQKCNMVTLHAPMPTRGWDSLDELSLASLTKLLFQPVPAGTAPAVKGEPIDSLHPGTVEGAAVGGNLSLLTATLGSPYEIDTKGKILFIEDVDEQHYRLDKGLTALSLAGKFADCAGIVLCTFADCEEPNTAPEDTLSLLQIYEEVIKPYNKPAIFNFRAGHIYPQLSIPMGVNTRLDATTATVTFLEAATRER